MNTLRPKLVPDYTALAYPHRSCHAGLTSVWWQLFPPATLFLTLLDRLTLASLLSQSPPVTMGRFPSTLVLDVALVFGADLGTCTPVFSRPPVTQG
jgi:hypothetical protein